MSKNSISEFEMEKEDFKIKLRRGSDGYLASTSDGAPYLLTPPTPVVTETTEPEPVAPESAPLAGGDSEITSPMIGTFYVSPSPDAPPFVKVGSQVEPDTVVCIIEAMKVMNEIKADTRGVIQEIVAENSKPVEFGQTLFKVKLN